MKKLMCGVLLAVLSVGSAYAASGGSTGKVTRVLWYEGHTGFLVQQEGMSDLGGCGRSDYYILDDQYTYFKEVYALLLAAHMSAKPLTISIDGCHEGIPRIKHVNS